MQTTLLNPSRRQKHYLVTGVIFLWFVIHGYLAHNRSIWVDEWLHFDQIVYPIAEALKTLFEEISPFAPGQLILGRLFYAITGGFPSSEFSGRLSSLLMGSLTVLLAFRMRLKALPFMVMFSVALCSMATQSRPYSALIFAAAMAYKLIWDKRPLDRVDTALTWFALFFGHIYGICYVAFACFLRKDWKKVFIGCSWLALILWAHVWPGGKLSPFEKADFPDILSVFKQSMGAIGNPYKVSYFFAAFGLYGLAVLIQRRQYRLLLELTAYFLAVLIGPIVANAISGYYFSPRQMVGGMFSFMAISAFGMEQLLERFKTNKAFIVSLSALVFAASFGPWVAFINGVPPFIDQPLSKVKIILVEALGNGTKNILWSDSGLWSTATNYMNILLKEPDTKYEIINLNGFAAARVCYRQQSFCIYGMTDSDQFTHQHTHYINESPEFAKLLESTNPKFDLLVHTVEKLKLKTSIPTRRTY